MAADRVQLVVPCFNESRRLDVSAFSSALDAMPWLDLCFVDDGSTDTTGEMLSAIQRGWPLRTSVLALPRNVGKAEAVRQGLLYASATSSISGFWDADLAAPLDELATLRGVMDADPLIEWVWGIRLRALGRRVERRLSRHYLGRIFATVASATLGLHSYDTQCGAKLFRVSPLLRAVIAEPFISRWIFDIEMLARADGLLGGTGGSGVERAVYEQPLRAWQHRAGSKVRSVDFLRALVELARIRSDRARWTPRPSLAAG
jgi:dolichyl-phosphate beta-glucosyltransferase